MNNLIIIVIIAAIINSIAQVIDKKIVKKGIKRKDYFYLMCLSMIPFALIMTIIEYKTGNLKFEFNILLIVLLILAMIFRYIKQNTVVGCLKHLNPYEDAAYMTIGIVFAYIIDVFLGSQTLLIDSAFAIISILLGVFFIADSKLKLNNLKKDLFIRITATLIISYITYFALKYISNALFLLIINLILTLSFSVKYKKEYYIKNKNIVKWVFIQQSFGFIYLYLTNYIISNSVTLSSCISPTALIFLLIIAIISNKHEKPKLIQIIGVIGIVLGLFLLR